MHTNSQRLKVALAQISPVWFQREKTLNKVIDYVKQAAAENCHLVTFGEALVPGYPFWIELTNGSKFNCEQQKSIQAEYAVQAVQIERGDLVALCSVAAEHDIAIYLGIIERPKARSGHSLYCSMVYIDQQGIIQSVHRKLMPTYEERLSWSIGDGNGLVTHPLEDFTVGGLNCWENWMPLARASLHAQGEDLHVAIWPGNLKNTFDLTQVMAKEGRSYVISVCGIMQKSDLVGAVPELDTLLSEAGISENVQSNDVLLANGGSCIANPDGSWLVEPQVGEEALIIAELDHTFVRKERQNFDPSGHYSRPDVLSLNVDRTRQKIAIFKD